MPLIIRCVLLATILVAGVSNANVDKDFLAARDAYAKGRTDLFNRHAARVPASYPLVSYLRYWRARGDASQTAALNAFIDAHPESPLSERARQELARFYGKREDWSAFRQVVGALASVDRETECYALRGRLLEGDPAVAEEGLQLYLTPQDLPSACKALFAALGANGSLTAEHRLSRLRLALELGNQRLAKELLGEIPSEDRPDTRLLETAERTPEKLLAEDTADPVKQEVVLYALSRLARTEPERAANLWQDGAERRPENMQLYGWGVIGMAAARRHDPGAVAWFVRARDQLSEAQRVWRVRTMLRAGRWLDVFQGIATLPTRIQGEAVWRYWKARALQALNVGFAANQLFAELAGQPHYYGLLADEELGPRVEARTSEYRPSEADMRLAEGNAGLARALLLRRLGLYADAVSEWTWASRGFDDAALLAAAELARQAQWYDRAIITAEKTKSVHSFDLRYLTPYRDLADSYAGRNNLDPAWVYGLMRQESRFVDYARSSAGAQGLMQIMPGTAKWIAGQLGLDGKAHRQMHQPEANIRFGTFYLRRIQEGLQGSPVLATAGYNAGPGRARRWQAEVPLEGAIYVESIPFTETREYVKKVLANAVHYSRRLGLSGDSLKARLGVVPARTGSSPGGDPEVDS